MANYRRKNKNQNANPEVNYRINEDIEASQIRLIDGEDGGMIGVISIKEAVNIARERELDLVEINPKAEPPVVKLIDYNKFRYQIDKTNNKPKIKEDKVLRVSVRVSENDLKVKAVQANGFLERGHKVKLQVQMRGREKAYPEVAEEIMRQFVSLIDEEIGSLDGALQLTGDSYYALIKPAK